MIKYKIDVLTALKNKGISSYVIRQKKLLSEGTLTKLRNNDASITFDTINTICNLLKCDIFDIIEFIPDNE